MEEKKKITVIGGGSWATAIVKMLQNNVDELSWYMRNVETIEYIKKHHNNPKYISSADIDAGKINFFSLLYLLWVVQSIDQVEFEK